MSWLNPMIDAWGVLGTSIALIGAFAVAMFLIRFTEDFIARPFAVIDHYAWAAPAIAVAVVLALALLA
jgi:hypothetical protein